MIPGSAKSLWEGNGCPLQCSCLETFCGQKEPSRLQSMGSQRVGHSWATFTHSLNSYQRARHRGYFRFFKKIVKLKKEKEGEGSNIEECFRALLRKQVASIWKLLLLFHFYEEGSKYKEFEIMYKMLNVLKGTLKITKN